MLDEGGCRRKIILFRVLLKDEVNLSNQMLGVYTSFVLVSILLKYVSIFYYKMNGSITTFLLLLFCCKMVLKKIL